MQLWVEPRLAGASRALRAHLVKVSRRNKLVLGKGSPSNAGGMHISVCRL